MQKSRFPKGFGFPLAATIIFFILLSIYAQCMRIYWKGGAWSWLEFKREEIGFLVISCLVFLVLVFEEWRGSGR